VVLIRQVQVGDAPLVADIFAQLSATSRWMRFLASKTHLTEAELRYLTDIDHHDHEAFAALDGCSARGLGVARYIRHATDPRAAELAIAVVDAWHRRGLGTQLLTRLSVQARRAGIHRLTALTATSNTAMTGLLHALGAELVTAEPGTVEYHLTLTSCQGRPSPEGEPR
jgi:RimJ/RimL family protein N-acetyltransferase